MKFLQNNLRLLKLQITIHIYICLYVSYITNIRYFKVPQYILLKSLNLTNKGTHK